MTKQRSRHRHRRPGAAQSRYDPTPWPGLVGAPFVLLFNLVVTSAEDNAKTDGQIPLEPVETVQALIRQRYDFPDLVLDEGRGVALSLIGQFFHVDDYRELRVGRLQREHVLAILQGADIPLFDLEDHQLRRSNVADPQSMAEEEGSRAFWYKQRLLAFYFVGERAQVERLVKEPPGEGLLRNIMGVVAQALGLSKQLGVLVHPAFVPAAKMPEVSIQDALEWADVMKDALKTGQVEAISVVGPPGPSYTVRRDDN